MMVKADIKASRQDQRVKLNIGGTMFETSKSTLNTVPDTILSQLSTEHDSYNPADDTYFFDRDPAIFGQILNMYRWGELHVPNHVCVEGFRKELDFWRIPRDKIAPCCWKVYYQVDDDLETLKTLDIVSKKKSNYEEFVDTEVRYFSISNACGVTVRERIWRLLDQVDSSKWAKAWYVSYLILNLVSVVVYLLWMIPEMRVKHYLSDPYANESSKVVRLMDTDPHPVLFILDAFCMTVFIAEFLIHFIVCPVKWKFFKVWYNTLNSVLILNMCVSFALQIRKDLIKSGGIGVLYYFLKNSNVFRLFMLLRLQKQFSGLRVFLLAIKASGKELLLLFLAFFTAVIMFAGLMFLAEIYEESFPSMYVAIWWAIITMTTVGYGEVVPKNIFGYIIASFCAMSGVVILALPVAVVGSNFARLYFRNSDRDRHMKTIVIEKESRQKS